MDDVLPSPGVSRTGLGSCNTEEILLSAGICDSELGLDNAQGSFLLFSQVFPVAHIFWITKKRP